MDDLELRASRSNVCKVVEDMYICYAYQESQPSTYEKQPVENAVNFQRNASMAIVLVPEKLTPKPPPPPPPPPLKILCKFGEPS